MKAKNLIEHFNIVATYHKYRDPQEGDDVVKKFNYKVATPRIACTKALYPIIINRQQAGVVKD